MNKNKLTLLWGLSLLCLAQGATAQGNENQQTNNLTYTQQFDEQFNIQAAEVPNGYLYDRVYPTADLENVKPCDTLESSRVLQAWWEMENSNLNFHMPKWFETLREEVQMATLNSTLPIVAIDFRSSAIDTLAYTDGRLFLEGERYRIKAGSNPFYSFRSALVGVATHEVNAGEDYQVVFDPKFFVTNVGIMPRMVKFTNHQSNLSFEINLGQSTSLSFENPGLVMCSTEIEMMDGSTICNNFVIQVFGRIPIDPNQCTNSSSFLVESDIPYMGLSENVATTSIADAHIFFHKTPDNPCLVVRPVIVVDGFDPMDSRGVIKIREAVNYTKTGKSENLITDLQNAGYDVIVLNFPIIGSARTQQKIMVKAFRDGEFDGFISMSGRDGGADYIQRNAFLTVKLIQMVNKMVKDNGSNAELVVVGPSMGGMVTRYALSYMEKQDAKGIPDMKHNARLWLSFDAPQEGANISIATQAMVDFFGNYYGNQAAKGMYTTVLRSFAARQLLVDSYDALWGNDKYYTKQHHVQFFKDLKSNGLSGSNGWPQNLRKVSVINGNLDGVVTLVSGKEDIKMVIEKDVFKGKIIETIAKIDMRYGPATNDSRMIFEGAIGESASKVPPRSMPGMKEIEGIYGNQSITKAWFIRTHRTNIWYRNSNPRGAMDIVPGALYPNDTLIGQTLIKAIQAMGSKNLIYHLVDTKSNFTFIPSASAIGLKDPEIAWNTSFSGQNLVCQNLTYFDNYYAPTKDEPHLLVTTENAKWILQEINRGQKDCDKMCVEADQWPRAICLGSTSDLALKSLPTKSKYSITWGMDDALDVVSGQSTAKAKVKALKTNNSSPFYNISAIISSACAADYFVRGTIEVPNTFAEIKGLTTFCILGETFDAITTTTITNPKWYFSDATGTYKTSSPYTNIPFPVNYKGTNGENKTNFGGDRVGNYSLFFEARNLCGSLVTDEHKVQIYPLVLCNQSLKGSDFVDPNTVNIFPNPSANDWTVYLNNPKELIHEIKLYNAGGQLVRESSNQDHQVMLDIPGGDLANGLYFLQIKTTTGRVISNRLMKRQGDI